jgi:hypothetical protein
VVGVNVIGLTALAMVRHLVYGAPVDWMPIPSALLWIAGPALILGVAGCLVLFAVAHLAVEVTSAGIFFRFFPFHRTPRRIAFEELRNLEVKTYNSVRELRQWGDRRLKRRDIFTVVGNRGVFFELTSGQCYFLGSEAPERLARATSGAGARPLA